MGRGESRLVALTRIADRLRADEVIGALRDEGIKAVWRVPHSPAYDGLEEVWLGDHYGEILILDADLDRARKIVEEITQ
jgi:hypothetical protein